MFGRLRPLHLSCTATMGFCAVALLLVVSACAPRVDPRGNMPDPERLAEIMPGDQSREEVAEILGSPATVGNFDGETSWIYIAEQTETTAFFEPEVKERTVVILTFDEEGIVKSVKTLNAEDGKNVELVERETPTEGNRITIMEQLLGNFGRFNKE